MWKLVEEKLGYLGKKKREDMKRDNGKEVDG